MSHVLDSKNVKHKERIQVRNLVAFRMACEHVGLVMISDLEEQAERGIEQPVPGRGRYRGHKTVNNRLVGDWAIPQGWKYEDVDNNASYVVRVTPAKLEELKAQGKWMPYGENDRPYEMGLVWDEADQCFYPVYDFADNAGRPLNEVCGRPETTARDQVTAAMPKLFQWYHAFADQLAAAEQNQEIEFEKEGDDVVSYVYLDDEGTKEKLKEYQ